MINLSDKPKILLVAVLLLIIYSTAKAQQNATGLRAPSLIKIDGKLDEWNNKLPNFNKNTGVYYAISNDDKNIYLSVQAIDPIAVQKIISYGISFSLFSSRKSEKAIITFPLLQQKEGNIIKNFKKKVDESDIAVSTKQLDSLAKEMNKSLIQNSKEIKVTGITGITDTVISIYNEKAIKTDLTFTDKRVLNYELALPIAYIQPKVNSNDEINYNIQLNGSSTVQPQLSADGKAVVMGGGDGMRIELKATPQTLELITIGSPTDFTGKYKLAK